MKGYDKLMYEYYKVLNNAWNAKTREAAREAIRMLISMKGSFGKADIGDMTDVMNNILGEEFASEVRKENKTFIEKFYKYGVNDVAKEVPTAVGIGLYGTSDMRIMGTYTKQQHFWIGNHFDSDISDKFSESLYTAIDKGYTVEELRDTLKEQFSSIAKKGKAYWQGLAEHTSLRIREFGRLSGYSAAGARGYMLVNPMDDRTSDICRALVGQNKIYPLSTALEVRDKLLDVEMKEGSLDKARDQIKALAPWGNVKNVEYDTEGKPIGISGAITPFPPFHWKCRTQTRVVM